MQAGLYKAEFKTPIGSGAGVVVLDEGGAARGGDSSLFYTGHFKQEGAAVTATFTTGKHSSFPGMSSVFGRDVVTCNLTGTADASGDQVKLTGTSPQAPGVQFNVTLTKLAA